MLLELINTGQLTVSENTYWSRSKNSGPRGLDILQIISHELSHLCSESGLHHPKFTFTTGRNPTLKIPEYLKLYLSKFQN